MYRFTARLAAVAATLCCTVGAQAAVLMQDNFDADDTSTILDVGSLLNWTVDNGTVDYIRSGTYDLTCVGAIGGCIDTDGTSRDAGRMLSRATFSLDPTLLYTISFSVSGNQRGSAADSLRYGLFNATTNTDVVSYDLGGIAAAAPFGTVNTTFYNVGFNTGDAYRLFIGGQGGDNIGAIVDNLSFTSDGQALPEPGSLALVGLAGLAAWAVRRRRA